MKFCFADLRGARRRAGPLNTPAPFLIFRQFRIDSVSRSILNFRTFIFIRHYAMPNVT